MRCALVIGHTPDSPGVVNQACGISEHDFNEPLADLVYDALMRDCERTGIDVQLIRRGRPNDYGGLPGKINAVGPDFIIEMHGNGFEERPGQPEVSGTEVLHWHTSSKGKALAKLLQSNFLRALELPDRGAKPVQWYEPGTTRRARGAPLLAYTKAPCVIAEPFFLDNLHDLRRAVRRIDELVDAYVDTIAEFATESFQINAGMA